MKKAFLLIIFLYPLTCKCQGFKASDKLKLNFYGNEFKLPSNVDFEKREKSSLITVGKIISSCQKKGCWIKIISNSEEVFVTFKDYSFFVPKKGIDGKDVLINGEIIIDTISVSKQKHYAYDAGKSKDFISKIKKAKVTKSIIADGLAIIN